MKGLINFIQSRYASFRYAGNGIKILMKEEQNALIHLILAFAVIMAGIVLKISAFEWIAIIFSIGFVFSFEIINSAIERISDFISPEKNTNIGKIKDLSAAAVLVSALVAFSIGLIVFLPKII